MAKATLEGVEILRTGTFTDMNGKKVIIDDARLRELARNFDPESYRPQINHDHVRRGPSMGQIDKVRVRDGKLLIDETDVDEGSAADFAAGGKWPYRSAEIDRDTWTLTGVARLGAARPAVKGLRPASPQTIAPQVAFAAPESEGVDIYFSEEVSDMDITELSERMGKLEGNLADLIVALKEKETPKQEVNVEDEDKKILLAENARLQENEARRDKEARVALAERKADTALTELSEERRITPAHKEKGLAAVLAATELAGGEVEWDGKTVSLAEAWRGVLSTYSEVSAPEGKDDKGKEPDATYSLSEADVAYWDKIHPGVTGKAREAGLAQFAESLSDIQEVA